MSVHPSRTEPHPIEVARFLRGLTQRDLASRAGLSREGLALIEGGRRSPRLGTMIAIADALGVDIGTLFEGTELTVERLAALAGTTTTRRATGPLTTTKRVTARMLNPSPRRGATPETALALAGRGRPVFPASLDKRPLTPRGLLDATTDVAVTAAWWARWPSANVALVTGEPSGLVVLDVDGDEGADSLHELEREHGALPVTRSSVTPRGGTHFYFRWPGVPVKTTAGIVAPGIDIRGDGGYVLVPPSRTADGVYVVDEIAPPAPMPAWLVELSHGQSEDGARTTPPSVWTAMLRDGIPDGRRNDSLARLTGHLLRRWADVDLVAELVHLVNATRCRPPLLTRDVDRIIDSVSACEARRLQGRTR